jgi:hypothetical protein
MSAQTKPVPEGASEFQSEWYEPFPEPHTIPAGWDLSGVVQAATLAPAEAPEVVKAVSV